MMAHFDDQFAVYTVFLPILECEFRAVLQLLKSVRKLGKEVKID